MTVGIHPPYEPYPTIAGVLLCLSRSLDLITCWGISEYVVGKKVLNSLSYVEKELLAVYHIGVYIEAYATHWVGWVMVAGTYMLVHNTTDSGLDADQGRTFLWKYRLAWHGMQNVYSSIMISHPQPPPVLHHHQQYVLLLLHACHALSPMQLINFKT